MSAINDGGPAFPCDEIYDQTPPYRHLHAEQGMSLRDYFAAKAMAALLYETIKIEGDATTHRVARDAYRVADAMLKERSNER